jgi:chaperonin GroES
MSLRPLADRVLVLPETGAENVGGVFIPEQFRDKQKMGMVKAVGPGLPDEQGRRVPPQVEVGDKVLYSQYGGIDVEIDGVNYLVLREGDLIGVVE